MATVSQAIAAIRKTLHEQCKDMEPMEYMEVLETIASDMEGNIDALKNSSGKPKPSPTSAVGMRPMVDYRCTMGDCGKKPSYIVDGSCHNCGQEFQVKITKGHGTPLSIDCPNCEVDAYRWKR